MIRYTISIFRKLHYHSVGFRHAAIDPARGPSPPRGAQIRVVANKPAIGLDARMRADATNRETMAGRQRLARLAERFGAGERSSLYAEARDLHDTLCCLLEEAPPRKHEAITSLIERVEVLLRCLSN